MAHWLVKCDPETYGIDDLARDRKTVWDGVANPTAVRHMRDVRKNDDVLVYHTGDEKAIVGLARAGSNGREDPGNAKRAVFDLVFVRRFAFPVPLGVIKADKRFADWDLVRQPRLSVMPVPEKLWPALVALTGERT